MSNYNSTLQSNNTDLQAILDSINELPNAGGEQATPVISVNNSNGLITATAGAKTSTHQLAFQAAKTITPSTASQIAVSSGYYTGGNVMVAGDSNLVADNIKSGVSIFGVAGSYESSGIQYEIVTIPAGSNSVAYTLPRVTHAFGSANLEMGSVTDRNYENFVSGIRNNDAYRAADIALGMMMSSIDFDTTPVTYSNGTLTIPRVSDGVTFDVMVLLVNDSTASQISLPS